MSHQEYTEHEERHGGGHGQNHGRSHGRGEGRGHRFERGDLRYVVLEHLAERPAHGYELIRALEERFYGFYTPSPGVIYPTLQWLEDLGYVSAAEADGRKVYTITEEGRSFLAAAGARIAEIGERMRGWSGAFDQREFREELHALMRELRDLGESVRDEAHDLSPEKLRRMHEVAMRAGRDIRDIARETEAQPAVRPGAAAADDVPGANL